MDHQFSQAVLDAIPGQIALLSRDGVIVAINRSWRRFGDEYDSQYSPGVGVNYLDLMRQATGPFSGVAQAVSAGIQFVLDGSLPLFTLEYPCPAATQQRWLRMEVALVREGEANFAVFIRRDTSERSRNEEEPRVSEHRLRLASELGKMGSWMWDGRANRCVCNDQVYELLGLPFDDGWVDANVFFQHVHPDDLPRLQQAVSDALQHRKECMQVFRIVRTDGEIRWLAGRGQVFRDERITEALQMSGVVFDIFDSKAAEETFLANEQQLHSLTDTLERRLHQQEVVADLGMVALKTHDLDTLLSMSVETVSRTLNNDFCKVLELQPNGQSLLLRAGVGWNKGLVGKAAISADRGSQAGYTLFTNEPVIVTDLDTETRFSAPSLLTDHGIVSGMSAIIIGSERPFGVLGTHAQQRRDYTKDDAFFLRSVANIIADFVERQRIEQQYRRLVQSAQDFALIMLDPDGIITTWNSGAERIVGYTAEEAVGQSVSIFYLPDDAAQGKALQELEQAATEGRVVHEGWRRGRDGSRLLAECITIALRDDVGRLLGFSRILRDTTIQRRDEQTLQSVVNHSVDFIVTIDQHGTIQACGGAALRMFGFTPSELVGNNVNMLMPEPWHSEHDGYIASYTRTGIAKIIGNVREVIGLRKDGTTLPIELVITEFQIDGVRFFTGILRDITQRKELESQLWQSQKMEAVGQLAGGVAHDFNNLLTVINGYSEIISTALPVGDPHRELLGEVVEAGNRAASLTRQLLAFSRRQILAPKVLDLNELVDGSLKMLRRLIGEDVVLEAHFERSLHYVKADPGQIEQVILNLSVNARDAMPQGGTLTIATTNTDLDAGQCLQLPGCEPGSYVVFAVTDTGCGMTPEVRARIFEPFFTTKEVGRGTGLGLAMVYGIVKQSKGDIAVDSIVGVGTTFKVFLPSITELPIPLPADDGEKLPQRGNETVLLVEDESIVRKLARFILESQGYTVLDASSGREAINLEKAHVGPIHLLITDIVMPEMRGLQVVESILPRRQELKVLYMSGYTDDEIVRNGIVDAADAFLQKPFSPLSFARKVREVLDGKT